MCEIVQKKKKVKGGFDLSLTCKQTGKPISVSNKWGMFCEDMCDLEENKISEKNSMKVMHDMMKAFGIPIKS